MSRRPAKKAADAQTARDSLQNLVSGLGTRKDKNVFAQYAFAPLQKDQLDAAFRSDWVARKGVVIPAADSTREWRSWKAAQNQIEALEATETRLNYRDKVKWATIKGRLYGGAGIVIGTGDGDPATELTADQIKKDGIKYLHVLTKYELKSGQIEKSPMSPYYGQPTYYMVAGLDGSIVKLHPSRVIQFLGSPLPDITLMSDGWGDSVLQTVDDAIKNVALSSTSVAALLNEAKVDTFKIPNLMQNVGTQEYRNRLIERFQLANVSKSMVNALLMDKEEEWETRTVSFTALPDVIRIYLLIASGALDIPTTRFLGQSAVGLGSTGEGDSRNYYDRISSDQNTDLTPTLSPLDEMVIRSALGERPPEVTYEWNPLWQLSDAEKADVAVKKATVVQIDYETGLIDRQALAEARVNQVIEDGLYPGLEGIPDPTADDLNENDPQVQAQQQASQQIAADARPRSLYVHRDVMNWREIAQHFEKQGLDTTLAADMHVTIAYSRTPVDWLEMGQDCYGIGVDDPRVPSGGMLITAGGPRIMDMLGPTQSVLCLIFTNSHLCWRHEQMLRDGCSWDYPEFQPHVAITYVMPHEVKLDEIEPWTGDIVLGPEIFQQIDDNHEIEEE